MIRYYCSCGMVARSNAAWGAHRKKHQRAGTWEPSATLRALDPTKHGALTMDQFRERFPNRDLNGRDNGGGGR